MNPIIKELDDSGQLLTLVQEGFISYLILRNKDVFLTYDIHCKTGKSHKQAASDTSVQFGLSERQIERIVKQMK